MPDRASRLLGAMLGDDQPADGLLVDGASEQARELDALVRLHRIGALFVREGNLETVLLEVLDTAIALSGADFGTIQLTDAAAAELRIVAQRGFPQWWVDFWNGEGSRLGTCNAALVRGERVIAEDVERDPIFAGTAALDIQRRAGVRAVQSTPIMGRSGRLLGAFSTHSKSPHRPDAHTLQLLDILARQAADIVERADAEAALLQRNRQLDLLARTSQTLLLATGDGERAVEVVLQNVADLLGVESFYHYRPAESGWLQLVLAGGVGDEERKLFARMKFGELLCGRVAETCQRLVVEDLQHCSQPGADVLRGAGATSYAGFPLVAGGGLVGTAAFVSCRRTHFRDGEIQTIQAICDQMAIMLERNCLTTALQTSEARLNLALHAGRAGIWESVPATGEFIASDAALKLFGLKPGTAMTHERALAAVHPDDRPRVAAALARSVATGEPFALDLRCVRPDGSVAWLHSQAEVWPGRPHPRFVGLVQDVDERKQAEERLRAIADFTYDWESWIGTDGRPRWITPAVERITGVPAAECLEMAGYPLPLVHPADRQQMERHWAEALAGGSGNDVAFRVQRPDGTAVWTSMSWQPITATDGSALGFRTSVRDISDRKAAEQALCDRETHLRFALQASLSVVFEWDIRNDRVRRIISNDEALPETGDDVGTFEDVVRVVHPDDRDTFRAAVTAAMHSPDGRYRSEHRVVGPDGKTRWLSERGGVEFGEDGLPLRFLGIVHDITENREAEERLRLSEERSAQRASELEALLNTAPIGLAIADASGRRIRGNRANEELFGLPSGAELSKTAPLPPSYRVFRAGCEISPADLPMQRAVRGETVAGVEFDVVRGDGQTVTVYASAQPLRDQAGQPRGAVGAFVDITERKRAEEGLRASHATFRHLVEHSPFGIYAVDADFRLVQVSEGARKVFETVQPLIGRDFGEVLRTIWREPFATEVIERFRHTLQTGEPYRAASTVEVRADIDATEAYDWKIERVMLPDGRPGVVCHFYDLSERQRHEDHTKLLMREVNHRSKNILSLVQSIATLTVSTDPQDFVERFAERIHSLAASHDLLVKGDWKTVPLVDLVHSQLSHFADLIDRRITIEGPVLELKPTAAQAIGMALHELATNAAKYGALSNDSGKVAIAWSMDASGDDEPRFAMSWTEKGGPAVSPPKRRGFGSNVTSKMIEMSVGGRVALAYPPSGFEWRFACVAGKIVPNLRVLSAKSMPAAIAAQRQRRILIVEDEPVIATAIAESVAGAGFEVVGVAGSVEQAMGIIEHSGCDAAILDVNLGAETSEPIASRLSAWHIPFVIVSGYSTSQLPAGMRLAPLIGKPVNSARLIDTLRRSLSS